MATTETILSGDGTTTQFSFTFPYIKTEDVRVELQEFDTVESTVISRVQISSFSIPANNPIVIQFAALGAATNYQAITGAPLTNHAVNTSNIIRVRIYRFTSADANPSTFIQGSAVRAQDLNDNFEQILYIMQERQNTIQTIQLGGIGENIIGTVSIQDDAITADKLRDSTVTDSDRAVTTNHIRNDAVTTAKIVDNAVTTAKIVDDAVTTAKIVDDAVTTDKIVDNAITTAKITNLNVTTGKLADDSVTTVKIADDAVTEAKVSGNNGFVPTGAVFHFVSTAVPNGYLKCNGDTIPNGSGTVQGVTADFSALYALVGATLPDLRGEFIRGWDDGRGVDSGRSINTAQTDQNKQHNHTATSTVTDPGHEHDINGYRIDEGANRSPSLIIQDDDRQSSRVSPADADAIQSNTTGITVATTIANDGGSEARPRNVALLACIKY